MTSFVAGRSWQDYLQDPLVRSAVERPLEIVGEALNALRRADARMASKIPDLPRIVAFRNVLAHGYAIVDHQIVWEVATERVPQLVAVLEEVLEPES